MTDREALKRYCFTEKMVKKLHLKENNDIFIYGYIIGLALETRSVDPQSNA